MTFDTALNLTWALVGAVALAALAIGDARRRIPLSDRCRRALAVFVASVALFPCVSASDDMVRFERLQLSSPTGGQVVGTPPEKRGQKPTLYLARLLESLENFRISPACRSLLILCFLALVRVFSRQCVERPRPCPLGRSPPRFVFLSQVIP